jgi:hypothetical protein
MTIRRTRTPRGRLLAGWIAGSVCLAALASATAVHADREEYRLKAAFLLNFARLVEWPPAFRPAPGAPMVVGVIGDPEVGKALAAGLQGAAAGDHPIEVRNLEDPSQVPGCQIVFLAGTERNDDAILAARGNAALSVGQRDDFTRRGGVINFYTESDRLRFEINTRAADAAGLKLSSRLLRLGRLTKGGS